MIVVSFFSAKGGTGKTTFNMSMASFLKYHLGKAVIVLDADTPEYNLYNSRVRELDYKRKNGGIDESALYPVWKVLDVTPEGIESLAGKLDALRGSVDYVLIDFPGSCVKDDAIWTFARRGVLDLVVIPVDMDPMVLASALQLAEIFTHTGQKVLLFFNKVHGKIPSEKYDAVAELFRSRGFRMSECRIKNALAMSRDAESGSNYLRSTICFPEKTVRDLNPQLIDLFKEVIGYEEREKTQAEGTVPV
ncbi:MAG: ParA family protein [Bacteroidales bacterium]|jgi:cellulose biosynthesis protein BcsQ|nr:ParA family protein [Bacteroidales bacterium]MBR1510978.1 ParA family protein [Bacteroidales bacterium]